MMSFRLTAFSNDWCFVSPAWSSFCSADDIKKLDSFTNKSKKSDYCNAKSPPVKQLFAEADTSLFKSVLTYRNHLLYPLLPAAKTQHYELRTRPHNLTLTRKSCHYDNCNFISHMILMMCTDFSVILFLFACCCAV